MSKDLMEASNQWAKRPADERFWTLAEAEAAAQHHRDNAMERDADWRDLNVKPQGSEMLLTNGRGQALLTHYAFGQVSARVGAPADYLRTLPVDMAASALNHGLANKDSERTAASVLLDCGNPEMSTVRAITSDRYSRIWNADVFRRLRNLPDDGWRVPPARPAFPDQPGARPATLADVLEDSDGGFGLSINVGDMIAPAGLYCSDRDMFAFMVNERFRVTDGLARGFYAANSEVGDGSFRLVCFLYNHVCGNHIIWGASDVKEVRIIHRGDAANKWQVLVRALANYANASRADDIIRIEHAKSVILGATKDEVLDAVFGMRELGLSRKAIDAAYDAAETFTGETWNPRSAWGMAQGMTLISQQQTYASDRVKMDVAAGKLLRSTF